MLGVGLGLVATVALTLLGGVWARCWMPNRLEQWAYGGALALAVWAYLIAGCAALGWMGAVPWTPLVVAGVLGVVGWWRFKRKVSPLLTSPASGGGTQPPSPLTGRAGEGSTPSPRAGRVGEGADEDTAPRLTSPASGGGTQTPSPLTGRAGEGAILSKLPQAVLLSLCVLLALLGLLLCALPPDGNEWDALAYHLAFPKLYLQAGRMVEIPFMHQSYFPPLQDMLYLWGLSVGGESTA